MKCWPCPWMIPTFVVSSSKRFFSNALFVRFTSFRSRSRIVMMSHLLGQRQQGQHHHEVVAVVDYLQDVTDALEEEEFCLPLQHQHCKSMMRALSGLDTVQFEQELRNLRTDLEWQATVDFVAKHGDAIVTAASAANDGDAPQCTAESLTKLPAFAQRPAKFFTFLATGRVFQGQFERLLETLVPALVPAFGNIFRPHDDDDDEWDILRLWVERTTLVVQDDDGDQEEETRRLLRACLQMDYAPKPAQPADGGKQAGQQGQGHLLSYLEQQQQQQQQELGTNNNDDLQILAPVWIRRQCNKPIPKRCEYVLELPSDFDLHGMTSELDAVVVQFHDRDDSVVRLLQVWEAKATLNPNTLQNALSKKNRILAAICQNECTLRVRDKPERYTVDTTTTSPPRLGILGTRLLSPTVAARQVQTVLAESALETNVAAVRQALQQGHVTVPRERAVAAMQHVCKLAQRIDPMVVVSASTLVVDEINEDASK